MLYSYLHSSKSKRTESLDSWEPAMVITSLCGIYSLTLKITPPCKSLEWVGQPTLLTRHSWVARVDAKESRRLRTWASASLKSRKKVAKESQSKHPFSLYLKNGRNRESMQQRVNELWRHVKGVRMMRSRAVAIFLVWMMYRCQQNKCYPQRCLLAHFEATLDLSHSEFTCP